MQIVEDLELRRQAIEALKTEYSMTTGRPGTHQSELIYCLTRTYWERTDPEPISDNSAMLFGIGFGLERVLLRPAEQAPEPLELDGIVVSLDSIHQFDLPVDLKSTRMAPQGRKGEDGFMWPESWKSAFMAYRHVLNQMCATEHNFAHPAHILGDYPNCTIRVPPSYDFGAIVIHLIKPEITAWRATFTPEELEDHWAYLLTRRDQLDSLLAASEPQPFLHNMEYECARCQYLMRCQLQGSIDELMLR